MIFYSNKWSTDVVALAASAYQGRCIVPLLQPFVKSVCDENLHRNNQRKARGNHLQHVCADALVHTCWR